MHARIYLLALLSLLLPALGVATPDLPARERLKACDAATAVSAAREILDDPATLRQPLEMFVPALVLFQHGQKDDGVFWFYAAQLRSRYQLVFEQGDRAQLLQVMMMSAGPPINNHAFSNVRALQGILDRVLEWDRKTPNPFRDRSPTSEQQRLVAQVYSGFRELQEKVSAEGPALERQARDQAPLQSLYTPDNDARCAPGQVDPSLVERETRKEQAQVAEFVRHNEQVIQAAGAIQDATVIESTTSRGSNMPSHYTVYVRAQRTMSAEVDVVRSAGGVRFNLRCTTPIAPGQRTPGDPCTNRN
jgi:hypothetical protein